MIHPDDHVENDASREYTRINLEADSRRVGRLKFVLDMLPAGTGSIVDIGCGPGVQFTGGDEKYRFTGVDISAAALAKAKANGYTTVQHDVTGDLPFPDATFDAAVLTDILEHVADPLRLLNEARRIVRPAGRLIVGIPNHFFLWNRLRVLSGRGLILPWSSHQEYQDWNYFHLRFLRWESYCDLLKAAGLEIEHDLSVRFPAPFPAPLDWPVLRRATGLLRRLTNRRWRNLWDLHFLTICRRPDHSPSPSSGKAESPA